MGLLKINHWLPLCFTLCQGLDILVVRGPNEYQMNNRGVSDWLSVVDWWNLCLVEIGSSLGLVLYVLPVLKLDV